MDLFFHQRQLRYGLSVWLLVSVDLDLNSLVLLPTSEKAMATHSIVLAWKIPWMEEPGRLQSMGLLRVRHD